MTKRLTIGTRVIDLDGFVGFITAITEFEGSFWYDVRFSAGTAVRFPTEIRHH